VKYAFMEEHSGQFRISLMSRVFSVCRSGFYRWKKGRVVLSARQERRKRLDREVAAAFARRKGRSGSPGLTRDLQDQGERFNRKTVAASMKRQG
jgi:putative transposase